MNQGSKPYYNQYPEEVIDIMVFTFGLEAVKNFCEVNAMKYRLRFGHKSFESVDSDVSKALWYEKKAKEISQKLEKEE
jgi:hypothetical protein